MARVGLAIVVPLTSVVREEIPTPVRIGPPEGGVRETSFGICEQVRTISLERFVERWGSVRARTLRRVAFSPALDAAARMRAATAAAPDGRLGRSFPQQPRQGVRLPLEVDVALDEGAPARTQAGAAVTVGGELAQRLLPLGGPSGQ